MRIAFVSDLHIGPTTPSATLDNAFDLVARWRPDVLILGGDYVFLDATPGRAAELQRRVARIEARTKVAVMGNHDLWTEHNRLEDALHHAGARVLVNDAWTLPAPFDDVAIVGLDEPWTGSIDGARAFDACRGASLRVAVCHSPCGYPSVRGQDVALLLCGHTHGGQIALPGARPVVLPPGACCRTWPHGIHRVDGMALFVSRGLGGTELPVRTFAPPDVGLFVLRE